jgi:hypothetical protein
MGEHDKRDVQRGEGSTSSGSHRIRDGDGSIEAMTVRRDRRGRFARKRAGDPPAQLVLFGNEAA